MLGREPHQIRLGMSRAIPAGDDCVFCLQQYSIILIDQNSSKGMIAMRPRVPGSFDGCAKVLDVSWIHRIFLSIEKSLSFVCSVISLQPLNHFREIGLLVIGENLV